MTGLAIVLLYKCRWFRELHATRSQQQHDRELKSRDPRDINDSCHIKPSVRVLVSSREELYAAVAVFGPCSHAALIYSHSWQTATTDETCSRLTGRVCMWSATANFVDCRIMQSSAFIPLHQYRFKFTVVSLHHVSKRLATSSPSSSPSGRRPLCGARSLSVRLILFSFLNVVHWLARPGAVEPGYEAGV